MHYNRNGFVFHWVLLFLALFLLNHVIAQETAGPVLVSFDAGRVPLPPHLPADVQKIEIENWQIETAPGRWRDIRLPFFTEYPVPRLHIKGRFRIQKNDLPRKLILYSGGIHGYAEISVNGSLIRKQPFNYLPFELALDSEALTIGNNEIEIILRAPQSVKQGFPVLPQLYAEKPFYGMIRPIFFYVADRSISEVRVRLNRISGSKAEITYGYKIKIPREVLNKTTFVKAEEIFLTADARQVHRSIKFIPVNKNRRENTISLDTSFVWSPENPAHLTLKIVLQTDFATIASRVQRVALKKSTFSNRALRLNGKTVQIRGVNYHQNIASFVTNDFYRLVRSDFEKLKEAGFNAVRFPHYLPDPSVVHLADSLGLLVFAEIPVWQYPSALLADNTIQSMVKNALLRFDYFYGMSPSVSALSFGQELPLHESSVLRLMIILHKLARDNVSVPTYLSPIPGKPLPLREACDFYMYDAYHPLNFADSAVFRSKTFRLAGRIGVLYPTLFPDPKAEIDLALRKNYLSSEIAFLRKTLYLQGGFIQSFNDWKAARPNRFSLDEETGSVWPDGLFEFNHRSKYRLSELKELWQSGETIPLTPRPQKSNFFSIVVFFTSILFFAMYKRRKRLSDNIKRSLRHAYGFYIDLRERRSIPVYDSFVLGIFTSVILAVTAAAIVYYFHFSAGFQEFCAALLLSPRVYSTILHICQTPYQLVLVFLIPLLLYPIALSIMLKIFTLFTHSAIRIRQFLAISYWSGSPLLFMIPLALTAYHWLVYAETKIYLFVLFAVFIVWIHWRLVYSIRLFFRGNSFIILLVLLLSYAFPFLILWAVFKPNPYWLDYLIFLAGAQSLY